MLRNTSLAACVSLAAVLAVAAAGRADAQAASDNAAAEPQAPAASTMQPEAQAPTTDPQSQDAVPASEAPRAEAPAAAGQGPQAAAVEPAAAAVEPPQAAAAETPAVAGQEPQAAAAETPAAGQQAPPAAASELASEAPPAETAPAADPAAPAAAAEGGAPPAPAVPAAAAETAPAPVPPAAAEAAPAAPPGPAVPAAAAGTAPATPAAGLAATPAPVAELDPVIAEVRQQLGASRLTDATAEERAALTAFYAEKKAPVWVSAAGFTARASHAIAEIAQADDWGLEAKAFSLPTQPAGDAAPAALADAEIKLSVAVLKYARYARGGRLEPSRVSRNFDQQLSLREPKVVLATVAGLETPGSYLRALHPKHPQFGLLRQALLKLRAGAAKREAETVVQLPRGPSLKLGVDHPDVALLRKRLKIDAPAGSESLFDEQLDAAVKDYQRQAGLHVDGVVGPGTRASLNGTDRSNVFGTDEQRLIVNMERWRWMPEDMGAMHVWDNVPEFQARVVKNGRVIHQTKIIVGKPQTQTTIFSADMRNLVFGPEWGVPDSIKVKEILPYLRPTYSTGLFSFGPVTDTRILERQNMRVVHNGRTVDASKIDWSQVDIRRYSFIQAAGPGNALGAVKFNFPNKHAIYMHDTPLRDLFNRTVRAFSHGCVRVHNPARLAEVLLGEDRGWSAARVRELMARGGNNEIALSKPIPVHLSYFTTVASDSGEVVSHPDIYGHDKRVAAALAGRPMALEQVQDLSAEISQRTPTKKQARYQKVTQEELFNSLFGN